MPKELDKKLKGKVSNCCLIITLILICVFSYVLVKITRRTSKDDQRVPTRDVCNPKLTNQIQNDGLSDNLICDNTLCLEDHISFATFLQKMKNFDFTKLITKDHTFVADEFSQYVDSFYALIADTDFNQFQFKFGSGSPKKYIPYFIELQEVLKKIVQCKYSAPEYILFALSSSCYALELQVPELIYWPRNKFRIGVYGDDLLGNHKYYDTSIVKITYAGNNSFYYLLGDMSDAVRKWDLYENFDDENFLNTFFNLVILGKLHLNDPNTSEISGMEQNLYYAKKFVEIHNELGTQNIPIQMPSSIVNIVQCEYLEFILNKLGAVEGMNVPKLGKDLFSMQHYQLYWYRSYWFANVKSLRLAIESNQYPYNNWSELKSNTDYGSNGWILLNNRKFMLDKCQHHISTWSDFIIAVKQTNPDLDNDQELIEATNAVLKANKVLGTAKEGDDGEILRVIIPILRPLEYLGVELPILRQNKCIVHYRNCVTGEIYYKYYHIYDSAQLLAAVAIIQPVLNWYNAEGDFDRYAFFIQFYEMAVLAKNIRAAHRNVDEWIKSPIIAVNEANYVSIVCRSYADRSKFFQMIGEIFSRSKNIFIRRFARELSPNIPKEKILNLCDKSRFSSSNKLPFYSNMKVQNNEDEGIVTQYQDVCSDENPVL